MVPLVYAIRSLIEGTKDMLTVSAPVALGKGIRCCGESAETDLQDESSEPRRLLVGEPILFAVLDERFCKGVGRCSLLLRDERDEQVVQTD